MVTSQVRKTLKEIGKRCLVGDSGLPGDQYIAALCPNCHTTNVLQVAPEHHFLECMGCQKWIPVKGGSDG